MKDQIRLHDAIYNTHYGIKSLNYIGKQAGSILIEVSERFQVANLLLGCTELCLDWQGSDGLADRFRLVNPLAIVAKAMVMGVNCSTVLA